MTGVVQFIVRQSGGQKKNKKDSLTLQVCCNLSAHLKKPLISVFFCINSQFRRLICKLAPELNYFHKQADSPPNGLGFTCYINNALQIVCKCTVI